MMNGFETYRHNGWKGLVSREWRGRPDDLDKWLTDNPGQQLVNRCGRTVSRVMADGEELYVKVVKSLDDGEGGRCLLCFWKWFKWRFLGGRALKALDGTVAMREAGVLCAEAVLAARRTHWPGEQRKPARSCGTGWRRRRRSNGLHSSGRR